MGGLGWEDGGGAVGLKGFEVGWRGLAARLAPFLARSPMGVLVQQAAWLNCKWGGAEEGGREGRAVP